MNGQKHIRLSSNVPVRFFETIDSTSAEVRRAVASGAKPPFWVVGLAQSAGYGRQGRAWAQQVGDFAGTLLVDAGDDRSKLGQLSFVTALSVAAAIDGLLRQEKAGLEAALKWPNDVLLDGAKVSGILLESCGDPKAPFVSIGIGVNILHNPADTPYASTKLCQYGPVPALDEMLEAIDAQFWFHERLWRAVRGLRHYWRSGARAPRALAAP